MRMKFDNETDWNKWLWLGVILGNLNETKFKYDTIIIWFIMITNNRTNRQTTIDLKWSKINYNDWLAIKTLICLDY